MVCKLTGGISGEFSGFLTQHLEEASAQYSVLGWGGK